MQFIVWLGLLSISVWSLSALAQRVVPVNGQDRVVSLKDAVELLIEDPTPDVPAFTIDGLLENHGNKTKPLSWKAITRLLENRRNPN